MSRETKAEKAQRLLLEGRVTVERVTSGLVLANVRGEGHRYRTQWAGGAWSCNCAHRARSTDCSHVIAVKRIVAVDLEAER